MIFLNLLRLLRTSFLSSADPASQGQSCPLISQRPQPLLLSRAILSSNFATASAFTRLYIPPHSHLLHRIRFTLAPPLSSSSSSRATVAGVHRRRRRTATCLLFVPQFWYACSSVVPQLFLPQYCCVLIFFIFNRTA